MKIHNLTPTEGKILLMLSHGFSMDHILSRTGTKAEAYQTHIVNIRQKTGIQDTSNQVECQEYIKSLRPIAPRQLDKNEPTPRQLEIMDFVYVKGWGIKKTAEHLRKSPQTIMNALSMGCKRARITAQGDERAEAVRELLGRKPPVKEFMGDPMF